MPASLNAIVRASGVLTGRVGVGDVVCIRRDAVPEQLGVDLLAPRAFACSSSSITTMPAASPITKPSRSPSKGREPRSGSSLQQYVLVEAVPGGSAAHCVGDPTAPKLLAGRGYAMLRTYHRMIIDLEPGIPAPSWPAGLELRPFDTENCHARQLKDALDEAFVDEWGHESVLTTTTGQSASSACRSSTLKLTTCRWDGGEIAAATVDYQKRLGDWGLVSLLGVRPAWRRRRGLGPVAAPGELPPLCRARSNWSAALGVDSENPTGATRLYERAGMRILWRADVWRKELRRDG